MWRRENMKNPGAVLLLWTILSCLFAIYLFYEIVGHIHDFVDCISIGILGALFLLPGVKFVLPAWKKENERLFLDKVEQLMNKGKNEKARKLIDIHGEHIRDTERLNELKERISSIEKLTFRA
jgi:hypothetical protein